MKKGHAVAWLLVFKKGVISKMKYIKMLVLCVLVAIVLYTPISAKAGIAVNGFPDLPDSVSQYRTIVIAENKSEYAVSPGIYLYATHSDYLLISQVSGSISGTIGINPAGTEYYASSSGIRYKLNGDKWESTNYISGISGTSNSTYCAPIVYYCTKPIYARLLDPPYTETFSGTPVFPLTSRGRVQARLVGAVTTETTKPITESLIGTVGLLIPLLILLVGFWKGWRFLSTLLRRA